MVSNSMGEIHQTLGPLFLAHPLYLSGCFYPHPIRISQAPCPPPPIPSWTLAQWRQVLPTRSFAPPLPPFVRPRQFGVRLKWVNEEEGEKRDMRGGRKKASQTTITLMMMTACLPSVPWASPSSTSHLFPVFLPSPLRKWRNHIWKLSTCPPSPSAPLT